MTDSNQLNLFAQFKAQAKEPIRVQTSESEPRTKTSKSNKTDSGEEHSGKEQTGMSLKQTATEITDSEDGSTMHETTKPADFETMLAELEKVVATLEGELKLEQSLALFERGLGLSQSCEKYLQSAQQRIEILKRASNGEITTEAFQEDAEPVAQP